jgi:hypothetical protein
MVKRKKEELLRSMKLGHVPKSAVVGEDLAVAEENADLMEVDVEVAAAPKHMNIAIVNKVMPFPPDYKYSPINFFCHKMHNPAFSGTK